MAHSATEKPSTAGLETTGMTRAGWKEIAVLLVCVSIPCWFGYASHQSSDWLMQPMDFAEIYFGARCALHHHDPYQPAAMLREFEADGESFTSNKLHEREEMVPQLSVMYTRNLPTALFLTIPFALVPWWLAQNLWMILTAALLVSAAFLTWDLGAGTTPLLWASLAGFMLAESDILFQHGNNAGVAEGLCIVSAWCFLKERHAWLGVLLLAVSLVIKPHDSGSYGSISLWRAARCVSGRSKHWR